MTSAIILTAALLVVPPVASGGAGPCDQLGTSALLSIERDRIGPYPAAGTLNELRTLCPAAEETLGAGFESVWAALDVSVGGLTILAGQKEVVGSIEVHGDLSRIPLDARIEEIVIAPGGEG